MKIIPAVCIAAVFLALNSRTGAAQVLGEFGLFGSYDSNAAVTRSAQFIPEPKADYLGDFSLNLSDFFRNGVSASYRLDITGFEKLKDQDSRKHTLDLKYRKYSGGNLTFVPDLQLEASDGNDPDWNYYLYSPSFDLTYFPGQGTVAELSCNFTGKEFTTGGERNIYQDISTDKTNIDASLKFWHSPSLSSTLSYISGSQVFQGNVTTSLAYYSGLSQGTKREDSTHSYRFEETFLYSEKLAGGLMYEYRENLSNSDSYAFRANRLELSAAYKFSSNTLFIEGDWTTFDYYRNYFDTRFANTREDFLAYLAVVYQLQLGENLQLELKINSSSNDSNDSIDFNPITSKSYSSYSRNVIGSSLKLKF
jgi:hypothetical protein